MLEKEYQYYQKHKEELLKNYKDKYIIIKDEEVKGPFETEVAALTKGLADYDAGTFLIQQCLEDEATEMRFYSRVSFVSHEQYVQ